MWQGNERKRKNEKRDEMVKVARERQGIMLRYYVPSAIRGFWIYPIFSCFFFFLFSFLLPSPFLHFFLSSPFSFLSLPVELYREDIAENGEIGARIEYGK